MYWHMFRKPSAEPRICSSAPPIASVGSFGRPRPVEVSQNVRRELRERFSELANLDQRYRDAVHVGAYDALRDEVPALAIFGPARGDYSLRDPMRRLDLDVLLVREQRLQSGTLVIRQQPRSRVPGST